MISDVLFDAAKDIRRYLADPAFATAYPAGDPFTERIRACVEEMDAIRRELDMPAAEQKRNE